MNQYIFIIHIMNLLLHFLHFFNTFQCIRCRNCTIDFVSYKCLFRSLIVRLWTGVVLDMLCLQKNRGRNWGIFDPNDFLKLFLKRMDFSIYDFFFYMQYIWRNQPKCKCRQNINLFHKFSDIS